MTLEPERRTFYTLDGLRAVGAFLVVMRHVPFLFGPIAVPESFLAVDLFYLVSGFVVAHAYGQRLATGGFVWTFVKTRLIRLYPLYACGLILGTIAALLSIFTDPAGWWTPAKLLVAITTGMFMIPFFPGLPANGSSLDGPTWTLVPELVANFVYALLIRWLTLPVLAAIILVSGAGVVFAEFHYDTLDVGYGATQQWAALARVGFSFFTGVVMFRLIGHHQTHATWASWGIVLLMTIALAWSPTDAERPWFELAMVGIGFPVLLVLAGRFEPGPLTGRLFSFTGLISYGIYLVHQPMGNLARLALGRDTNLPDGLSGLAYGAVFLAVLVVVAWRLDRDVDAPVRKMLRHRFIEGRTPSR
jgi:peptidoglycan/LPS O-acetylase OafA/YrhL